MIARMPFENEHAARIRQPSDFQTDSFRRITRQADGKRLIVIVGRLKGKTTTTSQSFRFPTAVWTAAEARAFASSHDAKGFEPATAAKAGIDAAVHTFPKRTRTVGKKKDDEDREKRKKAGLPDKMAISTPVTADTISLGRSQWRKGLIKVGSYVHPVHGWKLNVTIDTLRGWTDSFKAMRAAGVKVPITVDHSGKADAVLGELVGMSVEGDWLVGDHAISGEKGEGLVQQQAVDVSVEIDRDFHDGTGRGYGSAITASSLVPHPIVPGQTPFVPMPVAA